MKTVQMTLDDSLVASVDKAVKRMGTTRSAFTRDALRSALRAMRIKELEEKQRAGYARKPVRRGEFSAWKDEQSWGER
jgi:metal-responsive CopG/Arc/MetJ family transcriptional regulator